MPTLNNPQRQTKKGQATNLPFFFTPQKPQKEADSLIV
jgi:hypothetical protein